MATQNPNPNLNDTLISHPKDIIDNIFSRLSVKDLLRSRSVSKSWLSLISSPDFVKTHDLIMYNIFSRLPVKALLRLTSVCKSWLSLISIHDFIKTHYSISTNDPHFTHHHLLMLSNMPKRYMYTPASCSVYSLLHEPVTANTIVLNDCPGGLVSVVGYCNGLFCLRVVVEDMFLWNPSTRKSRRLPQIDMIFKYERAVYEFCYDEWNDDFKVFVIFSCTSKLKTKMSVYSSKSDSWRLVRDFPFGQEWHGGTFANGAMHWIVSPQNQKDTIVSFDIKTEVHREVLHPKYGERECSWTLRAFGKSLMVEYYINPNTLELWVMNSEGDVKEFWTKLFTIPILYINGLADVKCLRLLDISVNGEIMLRIDHSAIILYNSKDRTFKVLLDKISDDQLTYVESLFSPHL